MTKSREQEIWRALDRARGTHPADDLVGCLDTLERAGIEIRPEDVQLLLRRIPSAGSEYYVPISLARFIADLVAPYSPSSILDPWAGIGPLAATVAQRLRPETFVVFNRNPEAHAILQKLDSRGVLNPQLVDPLEALEDSVSQFDLVVSCPPLGYRSSQSLFVEVGGAQHAIRDTYDHLLILLGCQRLSEGGVGAFLVTTRFMLEDKAGSARWALRELGFHIRACIEIPSGTFHPRTTIPTNVVLIERGDPGPVFVAQFSQDTKHQEIIRQNCALHREGKRAAQGRFLPISEFRGFPVLAALERVHELAKRMGLEEVRLGSIVDAVTTTKSGARFDRLPETPNSVYLPLMAATPATTSQNHLPEKLKSYLQLVIKEDLAEASFVAGLLNTTLGLAIRDVARRGVTIQRISRNELLDAPLFLPSLDVQRKLIAAQATIGRLRNELNELESSLWRRPASIAQLQAEIRSVNKEDRFQDWVETLPFPLASVLWRYHAFKGSTRETYERLLAFFEVLAEFSAVVHLSAFSSNSVLWEEIGRDLKERLQEQSLSLDRATFGTWKLCVELLSTRARKLLAESAELCVEMYRTHDQRLLECLTSKGVVSILQETNAIRNSASAHVGAVSEKAANRTLSTLTEHLSRFREVSADCWRSYELVRPLECKHRDGVFHYDAQRITGTRSMPFETTELDLTEAMEDGCLYLWSPGEDRALMVLPMIKILPSPKTEQNACYFYNRRQGGGIRFLSYHFETDPDVVQPFNDTARILDSLLEQGE
jgi:hypothetical protein